MSGPLAGVLVVELCTSVAGPYAGMVLAGLGARVVKVERPGAGDDARHWGPPFTDAGESVMFRAMNAGKESIALDLRLPTDRHVVHALLDRADVVLQNWRPGKLEALGIGHAAVAARNPGVVWCDITAFGDTGPLAPEPGYDPLVQAFAGIMAVTGHDGAPPVRVGTSIIDMGTGLWAALGVLAALAARATTGRGDHLGISLLETGLAWLPYQLAAAAQGTPTRPLGSGLGMLVPYQAFPTADGWLVLAVGNDDQWRRACTTLGRPDLAADPDLATNPQRVARRQQVVAELEATLSTAPAAEWEDRLRKAEVPASVVRSLPEVLAHPQVAALGMLDDLAALGVPALPVRVGGQRPAPPGPAPGLDEHGAAIRQELTEGLRS